MYAPDSIGIQGSGRARPVYDLRDLAVLLWRERGVILAVFVALALLGGAAAWTAPKAYVSHARLIVQLSQEYVYEPRAGDAGRGAVPDIDQVVQAEVEILSSAQLRERVLDIVGLAAVDPALAARVRAGEETVAKARAAALRAMERNLSITTAPDTPAVRLSYKGPTAQGAARVLAAVVERYLAYRREVFADPTTPLLADQRRAFESRLDEADRAYQAFMSENDVADLTASKQAFASLLTTVTVERFETEARLAETRARLAALDRELATAPQEVSVQRDLDLTAAQQLTQLRAERRSLLARYLPEAQPVRDLDARIAELEAHLASGGAIGEKDRRLGANPVRQALETDRARAAAEAASLRDRLAALDAQGRRAAEALERLRGLETRAATLSAERDVLQTAVRDFTRREQETRAAEAIAAGAQRNVRVVERPETASRPTSLRRPLFALALLFAAFTALSVGLLRVYLRRGYGTPASAARTLDLPLLAVTARAPR